MLNFQCFFVLLHTKIEIINNMLRIAVQAKGRLYDETMLLLTESGIKLESGKRLLLLPARNFPLEVLFLRDDDIPENVADKVADLGIVGLNEVDEKNKEVSIVKELGFSKCRISLAVPDKFQYNSINDLQEKSIATSYPVILGNYLKTKNITAKIVQISGSVEIAPAIGLADAICDIVSSGSTLLSNGLKEVEKFYYSQAVLISNKSLTAGQLQILDKLLMRINSVNAAKDNKYIVLNIENHKIDAVRNILPGVKSPTVVPLAEAGWSSIHSVIEEDKFWENIEKLREVGAQGILVVPIEKMII